MAEQPHVLVVDDDAKIAAALRRALIYEGYQVEVAPDGHIALARARDRMPDLAILDIMMPGIDGLEVTRRLRAEGDVPILLLPAKDGMAFPLYDKPAREWLEWAPKIPPVPVKQGHEKELKQNLVKPPARQTNNVQERRRSED